MLHTRLFLERRVEQKGGSQAQSWMEEAGVVFRLCKDFFNLVKHFMGYLVFL